MVLPSVALAHSALAEIGRSDLAACIVPDARYGITIKQPCSDPAIVIKAVGLAHQSAGHDVTLSYGEGWAHFDCVDCGLT